MSKFQSLPEAVHLAFEADDPLAKTKLHELGNIESIKTLVTALGTGDLPGFLSLLDPHVEMEIHAPVMFPWVRRARGIDAVQAAIVHNFSTVEAQMPSVVATVAQGNLIDITLHETGRIIATQQPYDGMALQHYAFHNGKIRLFREIIAHRTPDE